jgi:hypothetical protein
MEERRPIRSAQKADALKSGEKRQFKVRAEEGGIVSAGTEDFVIVGDAVILLWVAFQHVIPGVFVKKIRHF